MSDDDCAKFWSALDKFAKYIRQTQIDIQKEKELAEKKAKKEAERDEKKKSKKSKNVFENYSKMNAAAADDVVAMMTRGGHRTRRTRRGSPLQQQSPSSKSNIRKTSRPVSMSRRRLVASGQHGKGLAAEAAASRRRLRAGRRRK